MSPPSAIETYHSNTNGVANGTVNGSLHSKGTTLKATTTSCNPPTASRYHAPSTDSAISAEDEFAAHNYHPLPIVFARASGALVWDPEGREYIDFLSAYSAVNQGHCHPELVKALCDQASRLTLSSRAFYNDVFPRFAEFVTKYFDFDMVLPMNTGAEAVETAVKVARKWAYKVKGVPENEAIVLSVEDNFHGRTMTAISLSTDPESRGNYGPFVPLLGSVCPATKTRLPFDDIPALRQALRAHGSKTAALLVEPIQGEAGIVVPSPDYLSQVAQLCREHKVLLVIDEIQTGVARTGRMLCHQYSPGVKPDMVLLGKAISGGMYPVSCVLGSRDVLSVVEPGTHGSTYGGNPLGCAVAMRALEVVREENLVERAATLGELFRGLLEDVGRRTGAIRTVRGKGLLNAIVVDEKRLGHSAWELCVLLKEKGLLVGRALKIAHVRGRDHDSAPAPALGVESGADGQGGIAVNEDSANASLLPAQAKPTHVNIIRLAPPLVISEEQIRKAVRIVEEAIEEIKALKGEEVEKVVPERERGEGLVLEN